MFTFLEMLALVESGLVEVVSVPTSVIGGLRGSTATSDLVFSKVWKCGTKLVFSPCSAQGDPKRFRRRITTTQTVAANDRKLIQAAQLVDLPICLTLPVNLICWALVTRLGAWSGVGLVFAERALLPPPTVKCRVHHGLHEGEFVETATATAVKRHRDSRTRTRPKRQRTTCPVEACRPMNVKLSANSARLLRRVLLILNSAMPLTIGDIARAHKFQRLLAVLLGTLVVVTCARTVLHLLRRQPACGDQWTGLSSLDATLLLGQEPLPIRIVMEARKKALASRSRTSARDQPLGALVDPDAVREEFALLPGDVKGRLCEERPLPSPDSYPATRQGARQFVQDLLARQRFLQRCMVAGLRPWRTIVHSCKDPTPRRCGGLADRLRGAIVALFIAALTDRALFIEHNRPSGVNLETYVEPPDWLDWRLSSLPNDVKQTVQNAERVLHTDTFRYTHGCPGLAEFWVQNASATTHLLWQSNFPPLPGCISPLLQRVYATPNTCGEKASWLVMQVERSFVVRTTMIKLFRTTKLVRKAYSKLLSDLFHQSRQSLPKCTICFHIRSGKNVGSERFFDTKKLSTNYEDFGRCGQRVQNTFLDEKQCPSSMITWLVVSDNSDGRSLINSLKTFANNARINTTLSMGTTVHLDRYWPIQDNKTIKSASLHVFVDFHLLQQCRYLIQSPSGFSMLATISGPRPDEVVRFVVPTHSHCYPMNLDKKLFKTDQKILSIPD